MSEESAGKECPVSHGRTEFASETSTQRRAGAEETKLKGALRITSAARTITALQTCR